MSLVNPFQPATPREVRAVAQDLADAVHEVFIVHGLGPRAHVRPNEPVVGGMGRILTASDELLRWADIQAGGDGLLALRNGGSQAEGAE